MVNGLNKSIKIIIENSLEHNLKTVGKPLQYRCNTVAIPLDGPYEPCRMYYINK